MTHREIRLCSRPVGKAHASDFVAVDAAPRAMGSDDVMVKVSWLSIDPYLNERLVGDRIGPKVPLGARMIGRGIGTVVGGALPTGAKVLGELGWQSFATVKASDITLIPDFEAPDTQHLSILGIPGLTAWLALFGVAQADKGKVLLVTSAAGTVGSIAGQLARDAGLRVVGVTSGANKCASLLAMGFDAAIDRTGTEPLVDAIAAAVGGPQSGDASRAGFDILLDLAGGAVLAACLPSAAPRARIVLCGHVGTYEGARGAIDADLALYRRLRIDGFLVHDHASRFNEARNALVEGARAGRIVIRETVHDGLESAPSALESLLSGRGIGKHLVRVS